MPMVEFEVVVDKRWPVCPDKGPVLKAVWSDGSKIRGWWNKDNFEHWLKVRTGSIVYETTDDDGDNVMGILARLTDKEYSKRPLF